jgi:PKD repeat protein
MSRNFVGPIPVAGMHRSSRRRAGRERRRIGVILLITLVLGAGTTPALAATTAPLLWTAGGLSAGIESAGQAGRIAADASGNVAVVSGPSGGRNLAVTSYSATGSFRWRSTVSPSSGTSVGDWVVAAPSGEFVAVGHNIDSHGRPIGSTLVRYASDGTLRWRVDLVALVARLVVDTAGNAYLAFGGQDIQLHKYSTSGVLLWAKGATGVFIAQSLALSPDETDVVLTGDVSGGAIWMTAAFNATTGTRRWQVTAAEGIAARDVVVDATRVYVAGEGNVGVNGFLTVVAYDRATGARLWRTDANPPTCCAYASRIALAPDGSLAVAGQTSSGGYFDWWIVAFSANGAVRWQARRDAAITGDEIPAAVLVLADGTTVVSGTGGPVTRDILGNSYMQGVTAGYSPNGTLLWEAFSKLPTVWATALPNGDVCSTGGYDAFITCWRVPGGSSNLAPTAVISATPATGAAPLTVTFDGSASSDPDGTISSWSWSFGDGTTSAAANPSHTYTSVGTYSATLTVTDNRNVSASDTVSIAVNSAGITMLRSTAINMSATLQGKKVSVTGNVVVKNTTSGAVSGAVVSATWARPGGATVTQTATTSSTGSAKFSTTGGRGRYTLTVTNISKTGYTFDAANSALTKSITK